MLITRFGHHIKAVHEYTQTVQSIPEAVRLLRVDLMSCLENLTDFEPICESETDTDSDLIVTKPIHHYTRILTDAQNHHVSFVREVQNEVRQVSFLFAKSYLGSRKTHLCSPSQSWVRQLKFGSPT